MLIFIILMGINLLFGVIFIQKPLICRLYGAFRGKCMQFEVVYD